MTTIARADITGIVLAGGLGRRMSADGQGVDKGLATFRGRPLTRETISARSVMLRSSRRSGSTAKRR